MIYTLPDRKPKIHPRAFIAPSADVIGAAVVGENASVWFGAVVRADNDVIEIGEGSNVQDASVLHVDPGVPLKIGNFVTIGHGAILHGCVIEDGALVGIGARVLNGAVVGKDSLVGAHALITENKTFPPRSLIVGAPAKVVRELSETEVEKLRVNARVYIEKIAAYRELKSL